MRPNGTKARAGLLAAWLVVLAACATPLPTGTPITASVAPATRAPVATLAPTATARVPTVVCDMNTSTWMTTDAASSEVPVANSLTCEKAVAAAEAAVGPNEAIIYIEFHYGRYCPPGALCALSLPNNGFVIFHLHRLGPDILVSVASDEAGTVTASDPEPVPMPSGG